MSERNPAKIRKQVEVGRDDYEWFLRTHSEDDKASLSWITSLLLHAYREVCENPINYNVTLAAPLEIGKIASMMVKEQVDEGIFNEVKED